MLGNHIEITLKSHLYDTDVRRFGKVHLHFTLF